MQDLLNQTITLANVVRDTETGDFTITDTTDVLLAYVDDTTRITQSRNSQGDSLIVTLSFLTNTKLDIGTCIKWEGGYYRVIGTSNLVDSDGATIGTNHKCTNYV